MKKKTAVQIFLSSIVIAISLTIFFMYFSNDLDPIDKSASKKEINKLSNQSTNEKLNTISKSIIEALKI